MIFHTCKTLDRLIQMTMLFPEIPTKGRLPRPQRLTRSSAACCEEDLIRPPWPFVLTLLSACCCAAPSSVSTSFHVWKSKQRYIITFGQLTVPTDDGATSDVNYRYSPGLSGFFKWRLLHGAIDFISLLHLE